MLGHNGPRQRINFPYSTYMETSSLATEIVPNGRIPSSSFQRKDKLK
jgi:hypothetical protein